jgi:hypothetical protein
MELIQKYFGIKNLSLNEQRKFLLKPNIFVCPEDISPEDHSELIDNFLGLKANLIEAELLNRAKKILENGSVKNWGQKLHGTQTWIGLHPQTLQTPYSEMWEMVQILKPKSNSKVVDLGAGYGRMGIVLNHFDPSIEFIGYELVPERVVEGNRFLGQFQCQKAQIKEQDLFHPDFILPRADYYFMYDYGTVENIRKTLFDLCVLEHKFFVIAKGRSSRSIIDLNLPWLSQVHQPLHLKSYSIYSNFTDIKGI